MLHFINRVVDNCKLPILGLGVGLGIRNISQVERVVADTLKKCLRSSCPMSKAEKNRLFVRLMTRYLKTVKLRTGWNCRKARMALRPVACMMDKALDTFVELKNPLHFYTFDDNASRKMDQVLQTCRIPRPLPYTFVLPPWKLESVNKISEGSYGEVYTCKGIDGTPRILKIIVIYGILRDRLQRGLAVEEAVGDAVCTRYLSLLTKNGVFRAPNFPVCHSIDIVKGKPPEPLVEAWAAFDQDPDTEKSTHFKPDRYKEESLFLVMEIEHCGMNLLSQGSLHVIQVVSLILQTASSLAVAECAYHFEHRDLHIGNWMHGETEDPHLDYSTDEWQWRIPTFGLKAFVIDFTMSRIQVDGNVYAMDLTDLSIHSTETEEINSDLIHTKVYKKMKDELNGDFNKYLPKTNIWFLKYLIATMHTMLQNNADNSEEALTTTDETALYALTKLNSRIEYYTTTLDFIKAEVFELPGLLGSINNSANTAL